MLLVVWHAYYIVYVQILFIKDAYSESFPQLLY